MAVCTCRRPELPKRDIERLSAMGERRIAWSLHLPAVLQADLAEIAYERGVRPPALVREILADWLDGQGYLRPDDDGDDA
jgi:hypothetical protein